MAVDINYPGNTKRHIEKDPNYLQLTIDEYRNAIDESPMFITKDNKKIYNRMSCGFTYKGYVERANKPTGDSCIDYFSTEEIAKNYLELKLKLNEADAVTKEIKKKLKALKTNGQSK